MIRFLLATLLFGLAGSAPAENTPPTAPPPEAAPSKPATLLELWSPAELSGKPGYEKIKPLKQPDFSPPKQTSPSGSLPKLPPAALNSVRRVKLPERKKWVALTFDLCERADEVTGYDRRVVNVLREKKAKATFFAGGKWMRSHADKTMQLLADPLFEIGNHGWTHGNLRVLSGQPMLDQILWTQAEYETLRNGLNDKAKAHGLESEMARIPPQLATLRFPYGTCSEESLHATNAVGLAAIQWDVVSGDPGGIAPVPRLLRAIRPGSITVFHANGRGKGTAAALPKLIDGLRAKGYELVTVSEMLAAGTPEAAATCYELKPGDNQRYDAKFGTGMMRSGQRAATTSPKTPETKVQQAAQPGP